MNKWVMETTELAIKIYLMVYTNVIFFNIFFYLIFIFWLNILLNLFIHLLVLEINEIEIAVEYKYLVC